MGYHDSLRSANEWLERNQQADGGWGLTPGQGSSIVNTTEAMFVLRLQGPIAAASRRGLTYLSSQFEKHLQAADRGARVRYGVFSLVALTLYRDFVDSNQIDRCLKWLRSAQNADGGWGNVANDGQSLLFMTGLAVWALRRAGVPNQDLEGSMQYILGLAGPRGWALKPVDTTTSVANAYALLALDGHYGTSPAVIAAKESLLQNTHWGNVQESVPGALWSHCTFAWVLPALASSIDDPFAPVIAEAIRHINTLQTEHGWSETPGANDATIRSQFWAALALSAIYDRFDPSIHVPRIDAERTQETLREPEFVKIAVRSRWATFVPAAFYRAIAYLLIASAAGVLFGIHRKVATLPYWTDPAICLLLLAGALLFIRKRPKLFRWLATAAEILVGLLAFLHLAFGLDFARILEGLRSLWR